MRRLLISTTLLLFCFTPILAQGAFPAQGEAPDHEYHAAFFAGGAITYWYDLGAKRQVLDFCPEFGYLFNASLGVGALLGYEYESQRTAGALTASHALKISPFVRYYYVHRGPFNLFFDGGFGFNLRWEKDSKGTARTQGFEVGIRPGACVDLTEGLCLCLRMGFLGYRKDYSMGEEPVLGANGFGLRFAPEELMIGLELEF